MRKADRTALLGFSRAQKSVEQTLRTARGQFPKAVRLRSEEFERQNAFESKQEQSVSAGDNEDPPHQHNYYYYRHTGVQLSNVPEDASTSGQEPEKPKNKLGLSRTRRRNKAEEASEKYPGPFKNREDSSFVRDKTVPPHGSAFNGGEEEEKQQRVPRVQKEAISGKYHAAPQAYGHCSAAGGRQLDTQL